MKRIFRTLLVESGTLYVVSQIATGLTFENGVSTLIATGAILAVATFLIKPIVNILLLPLNILTFGLFKWVGQAIVLYIVDLLLPSFWIDGFAFPGYSSEWVVIPSLTFGGVLAYLAFSFLISVIASLIYWLTD